MEFCLDKSQDEECEPAGQSLTAQILSDEASVAEALRAPGYSLEDCTRVLEDYGFSLTSAIKLLLFGSDIDRTTYLAKQPFRKHVRKYVPRALRDLEQYVREAVREQYAARALANSVCPSSPGTS